MKTYTDASPEVSEIIADLVSRNYPDLSSTGATVQCLFVETDGEGPALSLRGCPCYAVIRIVSTKDRAKGLSDLEITIDKVCFGKMKAATKRALLDHELFHALVKKDKHGIFVHDYLKRPKFKMRKHDREFGWFDEIAQRHGENSIEVMQARSIVAQTGQLYFPWETPKTAAEQLRLPAPRDGVPKRRGGRKAA